MHIYKRSTSLIFCLTFIGSFNNHKPANLDNWTGHYNFEEKPVKAKAGYYMVMKWDLSIEKKNNIYQGTLEVNGQQTHVKLLTKIRGNKDAIAIIYNNRPLGSNETPRKGDTLFTLSKNADKLITKWFALEPRLLESKKKECNCFMQVK